MPELKRTLGPPMLAWYGIGTIVGGGFYALIGKVAAEAGIFAPFSYLVAAGIAFLSALSYGTRLASKGDDAVLPVLDVGLNPE